MTDVTAGTADLWRDASVAAELLAVDPHGLGGVWLKAPAGTRGEAWLARLKVLAGPQAPILKGSVRCRRTASCSVVLISRPRSPPNRPVAQEGLLARADGGLLIAVMAERLSATAAAHIAAVLDAGAVTAERDGLSLQAKARFGVVALDESTSLEERPPQVLLERLGVMLDLSTLSHRDCTPMLMARAPDEIAAARAHLRLVSVPNHIVEALCAACAALGVASLQAPVFAVKAARAAAALAGRRVAADEDAALCRPAGDRVPGHAAPRCRGRGG